MPASPGEFLTQSEIADRVGSGKPVTLPDFADGEDQTVAQAREVPAQLILDSISKYGSEVSLPISLKNVIITGSLRIHFTVFESAFSITSSKFAENVDLSRCSFEKEASFADSAFTGDLNLSGTSTASDVDLTGLTCRNLDLTGMRIGGSLNADGLDCEVGLLNSIQVGRDANLGLWLGRPVRVANQLSLVNGSIEGQCLLLSAQLNGDVTCDFTKFKGGLFLSDTSGSASNAIAPTIISGNATFISASISAIAVFSYAEFRSACGFDSCQFCCDAHFNGAVFGTESGPPPALFRIGEAISFAGCDFVGAADLKKARFLHSCAFNGAHFRSEVLFHSAVFRRTTRFDDVRFEMSAYFCDNNSRNPAVFESGVSFRNARAAADMFFVGVTFGGPLSLQGANLKAVYFREDVSRDIPEGSAAQFAGPNVGHLDLRGFQYERIYVAWREAERLIEPFDKLAYARLESALRSIGRDRDADGIYLAQRMRTRKYFFRKGDLPRWTCDLLYWQIANYGVRPLRLMVFAIAFIVAGAWLFQRPGAVELKDQKMPARVSKLITLSLAESTAFSLNQFLPVEIPLGDRWRATDVSLYRGLSSGGLATVIHLAGWLTVPLGVAALTGLLRKKSGP